MEENEIYELIEKIYCEKKKIENSKEYKIGKKIKILKSGNFKKIYEMFHSRIILKKYKNILQKTLNDNDKKYELYKGNKKIVIYTCITGEYDDVYEPILKEKNVDYKLYTNNSKLKSNIFSIQNIPQIVPEYNENKNIMINRFIKFHPFQLFKGKYDYAIYIDGNIKLISNISSLINEMNEEYGIAMHKHCVRDCIYEEAEVLKIWKKGNKNKIDSQIERYKKEKFPSNFGLAEANVIITDLNNDKAEKILMLWWNEFVISNSLRDQLAFPYIIWKNGFDINKITTLGNNVYDNPKLERIRHKN